MSVAPDDTYHCREIANAMSCQAMTKLAKREFNNDLYMRSLTTTSPACIYYQSVKNTDDEMRMLAGNGLSKNMCFNPNSFNKSGEWEKQFSVSTPTSPHIPITGGALELSRPVPACFDYRTRPR